MNYFKLKYTKYVVLILFLYILFSIFVRIVNIYTLLFLIIIIYTFYNIDKKLFKKIIYKVCSELRYFNIKFGTELLSDTGRGMCGGAKFIFLVFLNNQNGSIEVRVLAQKPSC